MHKILLRIGISLSVSFVLLGGVLTWKLCYKEKSKSEGTFFIVLEPIEKEKEEKEVPFYTGDVLFDVLKREYEIEYEMSSLYGATLLSIGDIKTDFVTSYIAIYLDDVYASKGMSFITPYQDLKVTLKETKI